MPLSLHGGSGHWCRQPTAAQGRSASIFRHPLPFVHFVFVLLRRSPAVDVPSKAVVVTYERVIESFDEAGERLGSESHTSRKKCEQVQQRALKCGGGLLALSASPSVSVVQP